MQFADNQRLEFTFVGCHVIIIKPLNALDCVYFHSFIKFLNTASRNSDCVAICKITQRPAANNKEDLVYKNIEENRPCIILAVLLNLGNLMY